MGRHSLNTPKRRRRLKTKPLRRLDDWKVAPPDEQVGSVTYPRRHIYSRYSVRGGTPLFCEGGNEWATRHWQA